MKLLSIITIILGIFVFLVSLVFHTLNWPDLWNGLMTGPVISLLGIIAYFFQKGKGKKKSAPLPTNRKSGYSKILFHTFLIFIACITAVVLIFGAFVMQGIKTSEPYLIAKETAFQHPEIKELTGKIIGAGFMVGAEISGDSASLNFNIIGEKQDVRVDCKLQKQAPDTWQVSKLTYKPK